MKHSDKRNINIYDIIEHSDISTIKRLYNTNKKVKKIIHDKKYELFDIACMNEKIDIAKWIMSIGVFYIDTCNELFINLCNKNKINVVKWIYSFDSINFSAINKAFNNACYNNNLDMAEWLLSVNKYNISFNNYKIFYDLAYVGKNHEIFEWLFAFINETDNIDIDNLFVRVCMGGNPKIIQLYYDKFGSKINKESIDIGFKWTYMRDKLDGAKLLLSLFDNIDIHMENDTCFRYAIHNNNPEMIKLLIDEDFNYFYKYTVKRKMNDLYELIDKCIWDKRKHALLACFI